MADSLKLLVSSQAFPQQANTVTTRTSRKRTTTTTTRRRCVVCAKKLMIFETNLCRCGKQVCIINAQRTFHDCPVRQAGAKLVKVVSPMIKNNTKKTTENCPPYGGCVCHNFSFCEPTTKGHTSNTEEARAVLSSAVLSSSLSTRSTMSCTTTLLGALWKKAPCPSFRHPR